MSHYTEIKVNFDQKYEKELISALEEQFGMGGVEVHNDAAPMFDYFGRPLTESGKNHSLWAPPCHLIIRRDTQSKAAGQQVASNDAGYERTADGKYKAYLDIAGFSQKAQDKVAQEYTLKVSEKRLKSEGYTVKKVPMANGTVRLEASIWS